MPVYFGKILSGYTKAPPEFAVRKIDLLKSDVTTSGFKGLPFVYSALYAAYIYFLPFFMQATVIRKKVQVSRFFAGNYFGIKISDLLEWDYPDIVVGCVPGHDAEFSNLAGEVEGTIISGNKTKTMSVPNVSPTVYTRLRNAEVVRDSPCDQGRSNLEDFLGFLHVLRIFTGFLLTHQYPHQHDSDPHPHKRTKVETFLGEDVDQDVTMDPDASDETNNPLVHFQLIRNAKPSPAHFPYSGAPNEVPFLPGLLFPYFPGCILPSYTAISSIMKTYFFSCLGETEEECAGTLRSIKRAAASWAVSDAGLSLQHLAAGIQLAIESESRLFLIKEGHTYLGFVLLGYGFKVATSTGIIPCLSAESLASEIRHMESRTSLVEKLRARVVDLAVEAGVEQKELDRLPAEVDISKSVRSLRTWLLRNDEVIDDGETKKEIMDLMRKAYQTEPYWKVNKSNVMKAMVLILDEHAVADEVPFFVSEQVFSDTTKIHEVMSAFGPTGFSFDQSGGTDYPVPREGEDDVASELVQVPAGKGRTRSEKALPAIFVALKPMRSCVYDFGQVVAKRRIVQRKERAGAQKNVAIQGNDRDEVWTLLVELLQSKDKRTSAQRTEELKSRPEPQYHSGQKRKFRDDF